MSFVEEIGSEGEEEDIELAVPLSARLFGNKKLQTSPWRASVDIDSELLQLFGAVQPFDDPAERRVIQLYRNTARSISTGKRSIQDVKPILEYVSRRFSAGWVLMSDLINEFGSSGQEDLVLDYLMKYVEDPRSDLYPPQEIWRRISRTYAQCGNLYEALHALAQVSRQPSLMISELSNTAHEINGCLENTTRPI